MKLSSRALCLPIRVLGPLILATVLIVHSQASAQEAVHFAVGNGDCSAYEISDSGDVVIPLWLDRNQPFGTGSISFFIRNGAVERWIGIDFLFPWLHNETLYDGNLETVFFPQGQFPDTLFHLANIRFLLSPDSSYRGQAIDAIGCHGAIFVDATGYVFFPYDYCISPICIECQSSADDQPSLPDEISHSAYPNPFNAAVAISLSLPREGNLNLAIYDIAGRRVKTLYDGAAAGNLRLIWDGTGDRGEPISSGAYFYCIEYENRIFASKVTLLR
jgi:hypothetical protein